MGLTKTLTTTTSFSALAVWTRLICPSWSAPMVGTRPIDFPSRRHRRDASSIAPACSITSAAVPDLVGIFGGSRAVGRVLVLRTGELARAYVLRVSGRRARDLLGQVGVALDELGRLASGQPQHVVETEHLPV